jgi:hypothetical protein
MPILDQRMDFAGDEIDAGQQADRAMALVFMFTSEGGMDARFRCISRNSI